ncbi:hypothetical protein [Mycolicibacterium aubagnense]|uniref:Uncharacterized protein n=1 Tax=Mycolicibacterium aubagnense TaxID=319707 RepID=A0ABN5Z288_9MYCO|nr:hypothetical protein [Mycolicibacterium aubagnense]TLH48592.1 hypothetical protein C1S80_29680 [Mycolicibacterium aubagnense]BBX88063.1 hypothetical protein MAUB_62640 [Mycolicibacterium aubagnense]
MKTLMAAGAVLASAVVLLLSIVAALIAVVVDAIVKLLPLIVLVLVAVAVVHWRRGRKAQQCADDARLRTQWSRITTEPAVARPAVPLPVRSAPRGRVYLVRGDDSGLSSGREDGYVKVAAAQLPPARDAHAPARRTARPTSGRVHRRAVRRARP